MTGPVGDGDGGLLVDEDGDLEMVAAVVVEVASKSASEVLSWAVAPAAKARARRVRRDFILAD